jgi:dienelactone hydrolase
MSRIMAAVLSMALPAMLAAEEFPTGQVVDPVECLSALEQSYALYLPSGYQAERPWPIIYCFDPGGRGGVPVKLFKEAAEKFGFILVGSNNSRNGPWEVIFKAARAMWQDTHARFAINDRRVYAAGFSGGARAACGMGKMLSAPLAGVIGCGGGLPEWLTPENFAPLPWFGTAGLRDFNFGELQELESRLRALGSPHRLETFPGAHSWPPTELAVAALQWLELQAMKQQLRPVDEALVASWQESAMARAGQLEAAGELGQAYLEYIRIASDFAPFPAAAGARERASLLENSQAVKRYLHAEAGREDEYAAKLLQMKAIYSRLAGPLNEPGQGKKIIAQLRIPSLRKDADESGDGPDQIVASRLLNQLFIRAAEDGDHYLKTRDGPRALLAFQILAEIKPGHPGVAYGLASARALNGERKKALKGLAEAVTLGFKDLEVLASDPAWEDLRADPEFVRILASLRKAP